METSCGFILANHRSILLLQYPQGHWSFPKGHVEAGEDHHSTAKRELLEETGIDKIRIIPSWAERTEYSYSRKGSTNRKQVYWYLATTDEFEVKLSHEHTNFLWLDIKNALNQLTFEQEKIVLSNAGKVLESLSAD